MSASSKSVTLVDLKNLTVTMSAEVPSPLPDHVICLSIPSSATVTLDNDRGLLINGLIVSMLEDRYCIPSERKELQRRINRAVKDGQSSAPKNITVGSGIGKITAKNAVFKF